MGAEGGGVVGGFGGELLSLSSIVLGCLIWVVEELRGGDRVSIDSEKTRI